MSVKIDGIEKLEVNYYDKIEIYEDSLNEINVSVIGDLLHTKSKKLAYEFEGMDERGILLSIVQKYLNNFEINRITTFGELSNSFLYGLSIEGCNSEKKMNLQISKPKYRNIYNMTMIKYLQDRYNLCWNEDVKKIIISFNSIESGYNRCITDCNECKYGNVCYKNNDRECEPYISLTLKTNRDGKIADFEKKFIKDYLYYMFGKYDKKIRIHNIYRETSFIGTPIISEYILECEDMRVIIPYDSSMMYIFNIVDEYNKELMKFKIENEKMLKRQLKMEEF